MSRLASLALLFIFAGYAFFSAPAQQPATVDTQAQSNTPSKSAEIRIRMEIFDQVKALVAARDFDRLNAMELEFRTTRARTPSGTWKLGEFHGAVHAALPESDPGSGCAFAAEPTLKAWAAATPSVPTPYIATAVMLLDRAWCFRGEDFAHNVSRDAWGPFHENVAAAESVLLENKSVVAQDPEFYVLMEDIYKAEGRERADFEKLLDEASAKEPYYYGLYWHAYQYNQPQWSGSVEDIEAAARYAVERTRQQDGLGAYARYYWYASSSGCKCWAEAIDWETMKLAMRDVAERHPDPWNLANFAKLGCMFNDPEVARTYFAALGDNDGSEAWNDRSRWQHCRNFAGLEVAQR